MARVIRRGLLALVLVPVLGGLLGALLPAVGYFPAIGAENLSLDPFKTLFAWPGFTRATILSFQVGFASTAVSLILVAGVVSGWAASPASSWQRRLLSPILAVPHAASAFGVAFLIAPSGVVMRLISPWATGWTRPPDLLILGDPQGIAMTLGLILKEFPFLLFMAISALGQTGSLDRIRLCQTLGYDARTASLKTVFPDIYRQIRLPVLVVLCFSMTAVETAIILGPSTPPPLAVQVFKWAAHPDLSMRLVAAAGAMTQLMLVLIAIGVWILLEQCVGTLHRRWVWAGRRHSAAKLWAAPLSVMSAAALCTMVVGIIVVALWSVAGFWSFPDALPSAVTGRIWAQQSPALHAAIWDTGRVAFMSVGMSLIATIAILSANKSIPNIGWIYIPLIVPQIAFLPGLQMLFLHLGIHSGVFPVVIAHFTFVLPYCLLSLSGPWYALDIGYDRTAISLGSSPLRRLLRIRLPLLTRPILAAIALGLAVSIGLYLPTALIGGGRVATITTEMIALASGGDRRVLGVWASVQTFAAVVPFLVAILLPALVFRNRRGMHV